MADGLVTSMERLLVKVRPPLPAICTESRVRVGSVAESSARRHNHARAE